MLNRGSGAVVGTMLAILAADSEVHTAGSEGLEVRIACFKEALDKALVDEENVDSMPDEISEIATQLAAIWRPRLGDIFRLAGSRTGLVTDPT
jgi:hypothetical protein